MNETHIVKIAGELKVQPRQVAATASASSPRAPRSPSSPGTARKPPDRWTKWPSPHSRTAPEPRGAGPAPGRDPQIARGTQPAHRRAQEGHRQSRDPDRAGRHLPALPAQTPHPRDHRQGEGLEPLADSCSASSRRRSARRGRRVRQCEKGVPTRPSALAGARDILAEWVSDDAQARARCARCIWSRAVVRNPRSSPARRQKGAKFKDYFDWREPVAKIPSHRMLAMRRGESEGFLMMRITPPEEKPWPCSSPCSSQAKGPPPSRCASRSQDSYKRLLGPSMETEIRLETKKRADDEGHPGLRREPARAAAGLAAGPKNVPGHRPRLPHRLQDRRASTARASCCTTT